jgi:hypothetical protein
MSEATHGTRDVLAEQQEQTEPGQPSSSAAQFDQIVELREQGILTEEEFAAEKKKLLGI